MDKHIVKQIDEKTWHIDELKASMYLVAGNESALLIDTAYGVGDICAVVRSLTDLPLKVVITHAHPDHIGGISYFDDVYIHRADLGAAVLTQDHHIDKTIEDMLEIKEYERKSLYPHPRFHTVKEGDVFDLGGRVLEVKEVPGHSYGSIALLDKENDAVFSGDACNPNLLLSIPKQLWHVMTPGVGFGSVQMCLNSLEKIRSMPVSRIFTGHLNELNFEPATKLLADHLIACCKCVLEDSVLSDMIAIPATEQEPGFQCIQIEGDCFSYDPTRIREDWIVL